MLRRMIKQSLAGLIYYSGLLRVIGRRHRLDGRLPFVLMYHSVLPVNDRRRRWLQPGMIVSPEQFERQMRFLRSRFDPITLAELADQLESGTAIDPGRFVVTFDDGWLDNYEFALPVLTKLDIPATIFLSTDFIDSDKKFWFIQARQAWMSLDRGSFQEILDNLQRETAPSEIDSATLIADFDSFAEFVKKLAPDTADKLLKQMNPLISAELENIRWVVNWEEIARMASNGIDLGSHGQSHTILTALDKDQVETELTSSRRILEEKTSRAVDLLAYPNGNSDESVRNLARSAGYRLAVRANRSFPEGEIDNMALPRIGIHDGCSLSAFGRFSPALFACHLYGVL